MVKYLKSKKGYYYKLKKNGEKRRISKKSYNLKNKTRKNKKIIGGGKTETEIETELREKGKYDEWVRLGSYYGLTSDTLKAPVFLNRRYKYYDVDGNIVDVSMVQKGFRPDVDNIAVFEQFVERDPTFVRQTEHRIVNNTETLSTAGLATCTGLAMNIGTKKFMTHLDAVTSINNIIRAINQVIEEQHINPETLNPIIYVGNLDTNITLQKAKDICSSVGIPEKNYDIQYVCMFDRVKI